MTYLRRQNSVLCLRGFLCFFLLCMCSQILSAEEMVFSANRMNGNAGETSEYTKLTGNAYIKSDSLEVYADVIELSGKDFRFIKAVGNVKGHDAEGGFDFTANSLSYDRSTKKALFTGSVMMDDAKNEVKAFAERIEYDQNTEIAFMQINVRIFQKANVCTAVRAVYRRKNSLLELFGNAVVTKKKENGKEDVLRAQEITVNTDTEEITLDGNVRGTVTDE